MTHKKKLPTSTTLLEGQLSEQALHLAELVRKGEITYLTIDSCIVFSNGRSLKHGVLAQLSQFQDSAFKIVMTELVIGEIRQHIRDRFQAKRGRFASAVELLKKYIPGTEALDLVEYEFAESATADELAAEEIDEFLAETDAYVIGYEDVKVDDLMGLYFSSHPPFDSPDKKSEFPDAVALLSLEAQAKRGTGILVVTNDKDWKRFCDASDVDNLHIVDKLATALEIINHSTNIRQVMAAERFDKLALEVKTGRILATVPDKLEELLLSEAIAQGTTHLGYVAEIMMVKVSRVGFAVEPDAGRVRDDAAALVMLINIEAECEVWADFQFRTGTQTEAKGVYGHKKTIQAGLLITVTQEGTGLEVLVTPEDLCFDFGEVEPDEEHMTSHVESF